MNVTIKLSTGTKVKVTLEELKELLTIREEVPVISIPSCWPVYPTYPTYPDVTYTTSTTNNSN